MHSQRARGAEIRAKNRPSNGPLRVRSNAFLQSIPQRYTHVSCRGYACILLRRVAFCYENKVAPRIIVLFVLDRGYLSVRGVFYFAPYGKRIIREVKQNEIYA